MTEKRIAIKKDTKKEFDQVQRKLSYLFEKQLTHDETILKLISFSQREIDKLVYEQIKGDNDE